ncbi:MAG: BatA domain-containing protein [Thermoguttaceae bacterium]|jgi:hypothetical protein
MANFVHPLLLWGLPVVALPVLIHLINMLRHRRVEWAAMEFLLISQKKHRTWVILKQLLLLLLRMAAVAAVVLLVAQPLVRNRWGNLLGSRRTHHVVLLDDSFSMSDHWGDSTALEEAKKVVRRVVESAARHGPPQSFTLLRFSRAGQYGGGVRPDFSKEPVDAELPNRLAARLKEIDVSQTAAEPTIPLDAVSQMLGDDEGERRVLYLVSDFRARQWDQPGAVKQHLARLSGNRTEIHLVDCVDATHANLALVSLEPEEGIRAAGVRWRMEVAVRNFGPAAVRNLPVLLSEDGKARPPVTIAEIPPDGVAKERFDVSFAEAGQHRITARLEPDAVDADNARYAVVELSAEMPVLVVDGDPGGRDAKYLAWALSPGGKVRTGVLPRIETPRFLVNRPLDAFRAIAVANVERLDRSAVEALERYAAAGGGVAFFLGEQTQGDVVNRDLYRDGRGLFPLPLAGPEDLVVDRLEKTPDMQGDEHFVFRYLGSERNEHLGAVTVQRYFAAAKGWNPAAPGPAADGPKGTVPSSTSPRGEADENRDSPRAGRPARVLLRLRNGAPLWVEKGFGQGRVMAFLSTAAPVWNNWAANNETGSFPVVVRDLFAYLSRRPAAEVSQPLGQPIELSLEAAQYQPQVRFIAPAGGDAGTSSSADAVPAAPGRLSAMFSHTDVAGFYEAQLTRSSGKPESRSFAVNVDPAEGDLKALFGRDLAARLLPEVKYQFERAASFQTELGELGGHNLSDLLLYLLLVLLVAEQWLAWSAGYHPVPSAGLHGRSGRWPAPAVAKGGAA